MQRIGKRQNTGELLGFWSIQIGVYAIATAMKKLGLNAIKPKKNAYYPDTGDELKLRAEFLLKTSFNPITHNTPLGRRYHYIKIASGLELFSVAYWILGTKEFVGYAFYQTSLMQS